MKKLVCIHAVAALLVMASAARLAHAENDDRVSCQRYSGIPVALASGQPPKYTVSGELCATDDERRAGTIVQLLIHGATYNHKYWDFGKVDGTRYSYARDIAAHGFPAFALDEIGAGDSSHPPSEQLTIDAAAHVAHQLVQGLGISSARSSATELAREQSRSHTQAQTVQPHASRHEISITHDIGLSL